MKETYEVGAGRTVTVTIQVDDAPSTALSEAEVSELERYRRAHVCTDRCRENAHVAMVGRKLVAELTERNAKLESRLANRTADEVERLSRHVRELTGKIRGYDRDRYTERDRADKAQARVAELERALARSVERENKREADAAEEAELHRQSIAARDSLLEAATKRASAAVEVLTTDEVAQARRMDFSRSGTTMGEAIGSALRLLDKA